MPSFTEDVVTALAAMNDLIADAKSMASVITRMIEAFDRGGHARMSKRQRAAISEARAVLALIAGRGRRK